MSQYVIYHLCRARLSVTMHRKLEVSTMTFLQADLMAYKIYMEYNVTQI